MSREQLEEKTKSVLIELTRKHFEDAHQGSLFSVAQDQRVIVTSLVDQLREAISPSKSGSSGGSGSTAGRAPLNVSAVSLAREIELFAFRDGHGATVEEALEAVVKEHLEVGSDEALEALLRDLCSFSARIRELLYTTRKTVNAPCKACGQRWMTREEDNIRTNTLMFKNGVVTCKVCNHEINLRDYVRDGRIIAG